MNADKTGSVEHAGHSLNGGLMLLVSIIGFLGGLIIFIRSIITINQSPGPSHLEFSVGIIVGILLFLGSIVSWGGFFTLQPNEVSNLITTQYGYDIVQVLEKEQARLRPMEEVRSEILGILRSQVGVDRMQSLADQAHSELSKSPQSAEQIAKKLGLQFDKLDKWTPGGAIPQLGSDPQATAARGFRAGEVAPGGVSRKRSERLMSSRQGI